MMFICGNGERAVGEGKLGGGPRDIYLETRGRVYE